MSPWSEASALLIHFPFSVDELQFLVELCMTRLPDISRGIRPGVFDSANQVSVRICRFRIVRKRPDRGNMIVCECASSDLHATDVSLKIVGLADITQMIVFRPAVT